MRLQAIGRSFLEWGPPTKQQLCWPSSGHYVPSLSGPGYFFTILRHTATEASRHNRSWLERSFTRENCNTCKSHEERATTPNAPRASQTRHLGCDEKAKIQYNPKPGGWLGFHLPVDKWRQPPNHNQILIFIILIYHSIPFQTISILISLLSSLLILYIIIYNHPFSSLFISIISIII